MSVTPRNNYDFVDVGPLVPIQRVNTSNMVSRKQKIVQRASNTSKIRDFSTFDMEGSFLQTHFGQPTTSYGKFSDEYTT